jgi:hypothetical protein
MVSLPYPPWLSGPTQFDIADSAQRQCATQRRVSADDSGSVGLASADTIDLVGDAAARFA